MGIEMKDPNITALNLIAETTHSNLLSITHMLETT